MSVSSKSRKESTESNAAQQMHSTMGIHPDLAQLTDTNLQNDLPSRVAGSNDTDVPGDVAKIESMTDEAHDAEGVTDTDIDKSKRASWGQPPLPANADDASTDEDNPMVAYQPPMEWTAEGGNIANADWNRSTREGDMPATRADEPDRTLGNS